LRQNRSGEAEKNLPTIFGTPKFITFVTTACPVPVQSRPLHQSISCSSTLLFPSALLFTKLSYSKPLERQTMDKVCRSSTA